MCVFERGSIIYFGRFFSSKIEQRHKDYIPLTEKIPEFFE